MGHQSAQRITRRRKVSALPQGFSADFRAPYEAKVDPELMEEVQGFTENQLEALRRKAQTDRYFLAKGILGYRDVNPYTHGPMCRALEDTSLKRRMYLAPRGHLKTTLDTITDLVGDALLDPEEFRCLILNEVESKAIGFLSEIKAHFQNNVLIHELFPDILPQKYGGPGSKWSTNQACLNRSTAYKEWTWTAAGVGTALAGNHYKKIKCDDLIGFEARESPAAMRYAVAFAKTLEPLLIDMDEDFIDFVGTRWAIYDLYREMLRAYGKDMLYFAREDIEVLPAMPLELLRDFGFGWAGKGQPELTDEQVLAKVGTPQPIFPRKFSLRQLERLSIIDPILYYAQYKNNPIADGIKDFNCEKLNWCDVDENGHIVYRDPHGRLQRWRRDALDIVMTCDPNSGDLTAPDLPSIVVSAYSPKDQCFVLDSWSQRVQPDMYIEKIFSMWQQWRPRVLGIEKAGQQSTEFWFKKKARELGVHINVEPLTHKNRKKPERIRKALQPIVNTGKMFVRKNQTTLRHQFQYHPDLENDDELDALAYAPELWRSPLSLAEQEEQEEAAGKVLAMRHPRTGY
jgi:hypothetical protein